jgi:hypothetical protein
MCIKETKKCIYNNRTIYCSNKIKTPWNIKKAERKRLKGPRNRATSNYQNSPEAFNKYIMPTNENIFHDIRCNNIREIYSINRNENNYFLNQFYFINISLL